VKPKDELLPAGDKQTGRYAFPLVYRPAVSYMERPPHGGHSLRGGRFLYGRRERRVL
jgi:hypothetical protein